MPLFSEFFHRSKKDPPHPPPRIPSPPKIRTEEDLVQAFNPLALQDGYQSPPKIPQPEPRHNQFTKPPYADGFVGGFMPIASGSRPHSAYPAQSLTMQHALSSNSAQPNEFGGYSSPPALQIPNFLAGHGGHSLSDSNIPSRPPIRKSSSTSSPPSPATPNNKGAGKRRPRASSDSPISPTSTTGDDVTRCSGITKQNKRCTRQVKSGPALAQMLAPGVVERYCHQHNKELLVDVGFYARKDGKFVTFSDWIPEYLDVATQAALRIEMERARSASDVPGYIYTFEILNPKNSDIIDLKVGRAVNLTKRLDQWKVQCASKSQILRGFYPGTVDPDDNSLMKGRIQAGEKGPMCHRVERLVHLELADLVVNTPYLLPSWPTPPASTNGAASSTTPAKKADPKPCPDCGQTHKEIFSFKRVKSGRHVNKEWELIVQPVIQKWGDFVRDHV